MSRSAARGPDPARAFMVAGLFVVLMVGSLSTMRSGVARGRLDGNAGGPTTVVSSDQAATTLVATHSTSSTAPASTTTKPAGPGALPQTDAKPTTDSVTFEQNARSLWRAVVDDDPSIGEQAFFPKAAYVQIKAISDPASDWTNRLIADFATDVHALHAQLGTAGKQATFLGLEVPEGNAEWIVPGVEYNSGSYWRVYGSTLRYRLPDGSEHELPVTSLISWRGEWYVVHLGAIR